MGKLILSSLAVLLVVLAIYLGIRATGAGPAGDEPAQPVSSRAAGAQPPSNANREAESTAKSAERPAPDSLARSEEGKHGVDTEYFPNGRRAWERRYEHGKPEGVWTRWHENGTKWQEIHFEDGKKQGPMKQWHNNGKRWVEATFKHGRLHGRMTVWDAEGRQIRSVRYWEGREVGAKPEPEPSRPVPEDGSPVIEE